MNDIIVPNTEIMSVQAVLDALLEQLPDMSAQLRKAAQYVLDNPREVGVCSISELAGGAGVTANTLVRMAQVLGFEGYDGLREPFRDALRSGSDCFPDRAEWLQSIARGGRHGELLTSMAGGMLENVERLFAGTTVKQIRAAADAIVAARTTWVLGVGISYALAHNFAYLANMALSNVTAIPRDGSLPIDDVAQAGRGDVLLAMTFQPYRREVVDAVRHARGEGVRIVALSDSRAAPIALLADHPFVVPTETAQFFTSTVAASALLETLMAFVVADAAPEVIARIGKFHRRRRETGVYWQEGS